MSQGMSNMSSDHGWLNRLSAPQVTPLHALMLLAGGLLVHVQAELPVWWIGWVLLGVSLGLVCVRRIPGMIGWFLLGLALTLLQAQAALDARLPTALHGEDFDILGSIRGLPDVMSDSTRFEFDIESAMLDGNAVALSGLTRLNWYEDAPVLSPCSRWQLHVRLRPPRGLVNPGGHDSERSAVQHGVVAVGYVRSSSDNRMLGEAKGSCIDGWRNAISAAITARIGPGTSGSLLRALAVGDQSAIDEADWQVLRATGIGHLIAISGLHVGMFAALGALLARLLWKTWPKLTLRIPGPMLESPVALACALGYGLLAGLGVPTVRTLLMIAIVLLARMSRRRVTGTQGLALAAVVIMVWDPLAVLAAGFWLSFIGVAILIAVTSPSVLRKSAWRELPRLQLVLSIALLPVTVWLFGQSSLIGPLANLVAVPWVSFVVVPLTVCGSLLVIDLPQVGGALLDWAGGALMALWHLMQWMAALPSAQKYFAAAPLWAFVLALLGIGWVLLPKGVPGRSLGLLLALPLLFPLQARLERGAFGIWMFDVGQGLSILVRTRDHALLYDAGPRYPSGYDVAESAIVPSLHALGVDALDRIVISHGDGDHAGGAGAIHRAFPAASMESGEPERLRVPARACREGETWTWDGVEFRMILAETGASHRGNDRSCVLAISGKFGSFLLTGDLTAKMDEALVDALPDLPQPRVLAVAHHGSRNATSDALLDVLHPQLGLVSAGYRNQFQHPSPELVERFNVRSIDLLNTADNGFLHMEVSRSPGPIERGRQLRAAWWRVH